MLAKSGGNTFAQRDERVVEGWPNKRSRVCLYRRAMSTGRRPILTTRVQRQMEGEIRSELAGDKTRAAENGKRT
jgi:hypothetical protein